MPFKPDLILAYVNEYVVSETVTSVPVVVTNEAKTSQSKPKPVSEPIIEDWVSDSEDENETWTKESVKQEEKNRQAKHPRKSCQTPRAMQNSSRAVVSVNTARQIKTAYPRLTVNSARLVSNVFNRAHSHAKRPINNRTSSKNSKINQKFNTVRAKRVNTARPKVNTARPKAGNPQLELQEKGVIDSGCSRHITGNMSYLSDYEETDGGYVAFGGDPKGDIENLKDLRVKVIRFNNRTEFKNRVMNQFCKMKGIKREFSVARTPQQNGVAERKNMTLIEAVRTMLADSKLPTTFWAEVVDTACYVQNRVLVIKPHNKTPYELFLGRKPALSFMRPFGCFVTILKTLDHLGKFNGKANEGFFVEYITNSKAFKVFNSRTMIVEETLHITFLENKLDVARSGPTWLFDIDTLTKSMNYKPIVTGNQSNSSAGKARVETVPDKDYILLPLWNQDPLFSSSSKDSLGDGFKPSKEKEKKDAEGPGNEDNEVLSTEEPRVNKEKDNLNNTNRVNVVSSTINAASNEVNVVGKKSSIELPDDPNMHDLEDISIFEDSN
nr:ribonuclease H-like domain-containing protein [Tanacetum cinerariifolium]